MKRCLLLSVIAVASAGVCCFPQVSMAASYQSSDQATPPPPEKVVEMMSSKLSLTDDQKAKITPIIAERQQKMLALRADTSTRKMKKAREAKSIMDDSDKKIEAQLNDTQKKQYAEIQQEMREKMKEAKNGDQ